MASVSQLLPIETPAIATAIPSIIQVIKNDDESETYLIHQAETIMLQLKICS